jgi:Fe-S-cluster containining protein
MSLLGTNFFDQLIKTYDSIPTLHCGDCWGECCVSPTMTAIEFVYMMKNAQIQFSEEKLRDYLTQSLVEHKFYAGNSWCRFQDTQTGRCQNYTGRALACRLHGHEALRVYATPEMEFCAKQPDHDRLLNDTGLDKLLGTIRDYNDKTPALYQSPYYLVSLNLESWIDFYYHPEWTSNRPVLQELSQFLLTALDLPLFEKHKPITTLAGKFAAIDRFYQAVHDGDGHKALEEISSIQHDFPSVGSYFLDEARQFEAEILKNIAE